MYLLKLLGLNRNPYRGVSEGGDHRTPEAVASDNARKKARREEILAYFISLPDPTLELCGKHFGLTRERIRQLLSEDPETKAQVDKKKAQSALAHYAMKPCFVCGRDTWLRDSNKYFKDEKWTCGCTKRNNYRFAGVPPTKFCTQCQTTKPREEFTVRKDGVNLHGYCKPCNTKYATNWRLNHPEKAKETSRRAVAKYMAKREAEQEVLIREALGTPLLPSNSPVQEVSNL